MTPLRHQILTLAGQGATQAAIVATAGCHPMYARAVCLAHGLPAPPIPLPCPRPMRSRRRRGFTAAEDAALATMRARGLTVPQIAAAWPAVFRRRRGCSALSARLATLARRVRYGRDAA